jgi:hypothetical protein
MIAAQSRDHGFRRRLVPLLFRVRIQPSPTARDPQLSPVERRCASARQYLQDSIHRNFENEERSEQIQEWLDAYMQWYQRSRVIVADTKFRIKLNLGVLLELRGEMNRLDVLPVANRYGRPLQNIEVGVRHLDSSGLITKQYSPGEVARAELEFKNLSRMVENYAQNIPGLIP